MIHFLTGINTKLSTHTCGHLYKSLFENSFKQDRLIKLCSPKINYNKYEVYLPIQCNWY